MIIDVNLKGKENYYCEEELGKLLNPVREWLKKHNINEKMRIAERDLLINGYAEIKMEEDKK